MISFESIKTSKIIITDLANRSFSHFLIKQSTLLQIDLKDDEINIVQISMKNINSFTYVTTNQSDRYTFEKFYEIMIDFEASRFSIADYD